MRKEKQRRRNDIEKQNWKKEILKNERKMEKQNKEWGYGCVDFFLN